VWRQSTRRRVLKDMRQADVGSGRAGYRQVWLTPSWVAMLLACWLMGAASAWALTVTPGEAVTVDGILTLSRGEDDRKLEVVYPALRLRKPLLVDDGSGNFCEVTLLKLRMNRQQEGLFRRLKGRQVKVSGKIHYFEFGPNRFPNPAHFEVFTMAPR
jgi:hypothetical protein